MDSHINLGTKFLNGFLSLMIVVLVLILAAVVVTLILAALGIV